MFVFLFCFIHVAFYQSVYICEGHVVISQFYWWLNFRNSADCCAQYFGKYQRSFGGKAKWFCRKAIAIFWYVCTHWILSIFFGQTRDQSTQASYCTYNNWAFNSAKIFQIPPPLSLSLSKQINGYLGLNVLANILIT